MGSDILQILLTLAVLTGVGFVVRAMLRPLGIPAVVSLMALGMLLSALPIATLPPAWLEYRSFLSYTTFVLLLLRAGLMIPARTAARILPVAIVFGTIPVFVELTAVFGLSRLLLFDHPGICLLAAFIVAAVSPAVILPIMIRQREQNRSAERMVPERIIGMTIVNAFVAQTGILATLQWLVPSADGGSAARQLLLLPVSVGGGIALGAAAGYLLRVDWILRSGGRQRQRDATNAACLAAAVVAFAAGVGLYAVCQRIGCDSVLAALALGVVLRRHVQPWLPRLSDELRRLWSIAEIVLFINVGSYVDLRLLLSGSIVVSALAIVGIALLIRVFVARILVKRTELTAGEQQYTVLAQIPKATIQAVFGAMPLAFFKANGVDELVAEGQVIVILAAVAIVSTAPLGAVKLEQRADELLEKPGG